MAIIPQGVIIPWPGTVGSIPAGWSRMTTLDAVHSRGAAAASNPGTSGGSPNHLHGSDPHHHGAGSAHTHGSSSVSEPPVKLGLIFSVSSMAARQHAHTVPALLSATATRGDISQSWDADTVEPPFFGVVWIVSDGTPAGFPVNALVHWPTQTVPAGWTWHAGSKGLYLKGAVSGAGGGATGGVATHVHTIPTHAHPLGAHSHDMNSFQTGQATDSPVPSMENVHSPSPNYVSLLTHVHNIAPAASTSATGTTTSGAHGSGTADPPFVTLVAIQNTGSLDRPLGAVALWLGTIASIPFGWALCDGTNGTLDLRTKFAKSALNLVDAGSTGGSQSHTHSSPATHTHTDTALHQHSFSQSISGVFAMSIALNPTGSPDQGADWVSPSTHQHSFQSGAASVANGTTAADTQNVLSAADSRPPFADVLYLSAPGLMAVAITAPADGSTVTINNPVVTWTIPGGQTQLSYLLTVYADDGLTVVYTTGLVTSATQSATIPAGNIHNGGFYRIAVQSLSTTRFLGDAPRSRVHALFTPSPTVTGLTAVPQPNDVPPSILVSWTQGTISAGQTYVTTNVERRVAGSTPWIRIAALIVLATVSYRDYSAFPGTAYEYAITTTTDYGGDKLQSLEQSPPPLATLTFNGVWLHLVRDASQHLLYLANAGGAKPAQDQKDVPVWGRQQPTTHIGEQQWTTWTFVGAPVFYPTLPLAPASDPWQAFSAFVAKARTGGQAGILCVRFGNNNEGGFGVIDWSNSQRTDELTMYVPSLVIKENFFDLAV